MTQNPPNGDDVLFVRRLRDLCSAARKRSVPRYTPFLNEREQALAVEVLSREKDITYTFYGGYNGAVRQMAAIYSAYCNLAEYHYPMNALMVQHVKGEKLSHRDVLGSLIGLGVSRSSVGDIMLGAGECYFLVLSTVADMLKNELRRIGRVGVRCENASFEELVLEQEFEEIRGTVSSARLDSMVKLFTNLAREKASGLVKAGVVQKNYTIAEQPSAGVAIGDVLTIRGYGKYIVDAVGVPTRKGRLPITARKYK